MSAGDRDNFSGDISVTAPSGGYTKGKIYLIADSYYVARETAAAGAACLMASLATGAVWAEKAAGTGKTVAVGDKVYVKSNAIDATTSSGAVLLPAVCIRAAAATDASVLLAGGGISPTAT